MNDFSQVIDCNRIILVCGTGGVGKTTLSSALALGAAVGSKLRPGRRVLVVTIDPARRLADALGIDLSRPDPTRVWPRGGGVNSRTCGIEGEAPPALPNEGPPLLRGGSAYELVAEATRAPVLDALMLDTKQTFDRLIERYAPDPATAQTILSNPMYRYLSTLVTGSQEYMAMEKLYELSCLGTYDLIVVDTPPSSHAVDFLKAPQRLIRALTDSMLLLFLKPSMIAGKMGARILAKGADLLMGVFGRLAGMELLQEMADFLMSTVSLFGGFKERAGMVQKILRSKDASFVLVTTPKPAVVEDAVAFVRELRREGLGLGGVVVNRALPLLISRGDINAIDDGEVNQPHSGGEGKVTRLPADGVVAGAPVIDPLSEYLRSTATAYLSLQDSQERCINTLRHRLKESVPLIVVPMKESDVTNLEGLGELSMSLGLG